MVGPADYCKVSPKMGVGKLAKRVTPHALARGRVNRALKGKNEGMDVED